MSLKDRRDKSALVGIVKDHLKTNLVFRSNLLDWIEAEKAVLVKALILENNEVTRGKVQMLDEIKTNFQIGE